MKITFPELQNTIFEHGAQLADTLKTVLIAHLTELEHELVQDMTHISHFANYHGGMEFIQVSHQKDNLYKLDYSYPWEINWSCADQMEEGVMQEKVRFTLSDRGEIEFKLFKLES